MEPAPARIPVRTKRQAMDWSLVLLSQGIESTIQHDEPSNSWGLLVAPELAQTASDVIRIYRLENRRWPWRQQIPRHGAVFDWGALAWVVLLGIFYWLSTARPAFQDLGIMDSTAVAHGQWWRLFTATWLHADAGHFASNAVLGLVLLGLTMGLYGTGPGMLAAYLAGVGGNIIAGLASAQPHHSLGASGVVMGTVGLLAAQSLVLTRTSPLALKYLVSGIAGGLMMFVLLGVSPGTDVLAHFGGFISGFIIGAGLILVPGIAQKPAINVVAGFIFVVLSIVPWWLALLKSK